MRSGWHMTDEQRAKISVAHTGKTVSVETRAKISAGYKSHPISGETKIKISMAKKGRPMSENTRAALLRANLGRRLSSETRERLSLAEMGNKNALGYKHSPETRAKMSTADTGRVMSIETKAKISVAHWKGGAAVSCRKQTAQRRALGFVPLNQFFPGCNGHHIDREHVIYIPATLHTSIRHCVFTGKNMDKINALVYEWLAQNMNAPHNDGGVSS
jgi:hypothetical protein